MFSRIAPMLAMAKQAGWKPPFESDKLDGVDIEKEFELIQKKESKLSSTLRKLVVYRYEQLQKKKQYDHLRNQVIIGVNNANQNNGA